MAKLRTVYVCKECGAKFPRWQGKCGECEAWNSLNEEVEAAPADNRKSMGMTLNLSSGSKPVRLSEVKTTEDHRFSTGLAELDQVLGGGLVRGSVVLVGGAPGIGKSTLLLQAAGFIGSEKEPVLYVSGEESPRQIKIRADRLGVKAGGITIFSETSLEVTEALINKLLPKLVIIDSIQTMFRSDLESAPGSLTQVRECAASLMRLAKNTGVSVILVGHITKGGELAGPRILEHLVDTVLSFEAYGLHNVRALRAVKNRFGSTQETGFFAMEAEGLTPIPDASAFFLSQRSQDITGSLIFPSLEGTRPVLVEIQALVSDSYAAEMGAPPTRRSVGVDGNRLNLLLAVLQKKSPNLGLSKCDVYVNAAGGMRLNEPALDLPLLLAVAAARTNQLIPGDWAALGEVGLGGEVRAVSGLDMRLKELHKLGFKYCIVPARALKSSLPFVKTAGKGEKFDKIVNSAREALKAKEDPIGALELGPPLGGEWDDPQSFLQANSAFVKAAESEKISDKEPETKTEQVIKKEKTKQKTEEVLHLIPVESVLQALKTLGIKRPHSEAKPRKETHRDSAFESRGW
ncbi:DNA repair protein RadA [bacterium]|nr:DNA repair protein RadA [bacterium]